MYNLNPSRHCNIVIHADLFKISFPIISYISPKISGVLEGPKGHVT